MLYHFADHLGRKTIGISGICRFRANRGGRCNVRTMVYLVQYYL